MKELLGLVPLYLDYWNKNGEAGLPFLIEGKVSSMVLLIQYKKLPPIEELTQEERDDLLQYVKEIYPEGIEEPDLLKAVKIIYTIGTLL